MTDVLTGREAQIARHYAAGQNYQQIADELCLAPSTVRTHLAAIYRKLEVSSKLELRDVMRDKIDNGQPATHVAIPVPRLPERPSIAVLAFENMSRDPDQDYLSDGIADDIITALSRSPWLFVIARNTTFTYRGTNVDLRKVANQLGVRFVLEGSVQRAANRVRVSAQLIDGATGGHLWSERYDGRIEDVFDLQDEITRKVVASIQTVVQLNTISEPVERTARPELTVWELTMRSWRLLYEFSPEAYAHAKALLERALALDPESAEANMMLSLINHHIALLGFAPDPRPSVEAAYALARRAVTLDARNEYAHWALGISCWGLERFDESLAALDRAVALNPNCSLAYGSRGTLLAILGQSDAAIEDQEIAIRSNPLDPSIFFRFSGVAMAHYVANRFDQAIEWSDKALHRNDEWYLAHFLKIASYAAMEDMPKAQGARRVCQKSLPEVSAGLLERMPLQNKAAMNEFRSRLASAGMPK
ncbi:LuxR C-terminal-related transcriptional regulator [Yoonia litorea]|uniref:TolB amino-terminal domain-containing protein n=1 Tax=Yoonia litorea TaxID=1123755 RepID=A0A1I6MLD4_9RHOB|nr:LuxR C-terminal-related transcriptional regulator [Yoonia litorea]SFS16451.1 TolB amino-terminal domain-containing protein [Yoonia litorea]